MSDAAADPSKQASDLPAASGRLRDLLPTRVPYIIDVAVEYLRSLPAAEAESELGALAGDADPNVRYSGLRVAGEFLPPRADELALALLGDPVGYVRWFACELLLHRWCYPAAPRIAELLASDPDELVRNMAAVSLRTLGDVSVLPKLYAALETETGVDHEGSPIRHAIAGAIDAILERTATTGSPDGEDVSPHPRP